MLAWFRKRQKVIFYTTMPILALILGLPTIIVRVLGGSRAERYYTVAGEHVVATSIGGRLRNIQWVYEKLGNATLDTGRYSKRITTGEAIDRYVLLKEAARAGIEVPDSEVAERAKETYAGMEAYNAAWERFQQLASRGDMDIRQLNQLFFRVWNDQKSKVEFDRDGYEAILGGKAGLIEFERVLREEIRIEKLRDLVRRAGRPDPEEVYRRFEKENRKRKATILVLGAEEFVREVDFVLPQDPKEHYERNREEYIDPARVALEYVFLPYDQVEVDDPTDEEIQGYYDDHGDDFRDAESGEVKPIDDVRGEIEERLRVQRREEKGQEILRGIHEKVAAGDGDLASRAGEAAGLEPKTTEPLTLEAFRELPDIGIESVFDAALAEGKGALGEVGTIFEKGAYLWRVLDARVSREMPYSEVEEGILSDVEEMHQEGYLHYMERHRDRYASPTRYRLEYVKGPAGDDAAETRKALTDLREELEKKRRAGEEIDLAKEVSGKLELVRPEGPITLEELAKGEEIEPDELEGNFEAIRGDLSLPIARKETIYLFRLLETIEDEPEFEALRERVERDAAEDTERAIRRLYDREPERFRRPFEVDGEVLLADLAKLVEATDEPTAPEVEAFYDAHKESFSLPGEEEDAETGSRYRPFEEVKAEIAMGLRRKRAREVGRRALEALAKGAAETPLGELLARAGEDQRAYLRLFEVESMDAEEARDHAQIGSGELSLGLDDLAAKMVAGPFEGEGGPFLFRVTAAREPVLPPLAEVRSEAEKALVADREDALEEVYDRNRGRYREQEKYEVEYLIARYRDYLPKTKEPTDDEIKTSYEIRKKEFKLGPDEIDPDRPEEESYRPLEEVRGEIVEGLRWEDAIELAKKDLEEAKKEIDKDQEKESLQDLEYYRVLSDRLQLVRPDPIELGDLFTHDDLKSPDIRRIRQQDEGTFTKIIENDHKEARFLLRLEKKIEARTKEMDEVISEVEEEYVLGEALEIARERVEAIREKVVEGASLREAAKGFETSLLDSDFIGRGDRFLPGVAVPGKIIGKISDLDEGERVTGTAQDPPRHRVMIAQVVDTQEPSPAEFAEKEAAIRSAVEREAQDEVEKRWERELLIGARGLGDEVLQETYEEHFRDRVRIRLIRVDLDEARQEVAMEEAIERAEAIYVRLLYYEPFSEIAGKLSRDPESGGRISPLTREALADVWGKEAARAVAATPVGSFTRPVRGEDGCHIFLVEARKGEEFHLRHIYSQATPDLLSIVLDEEAREEARKEAEGIRSRIAAGESFAAVAVETSDDSRSSLEGGDAGEIGYADRGTLSEEIVDGALAAAVGDLSEVMETPNAFHIFKVTSRREVPLEEVWLDVADQVIEKSQYPYTDPNEEPSKKKEGEGGETGEGPDGKKKDGGDGAEGE